LIKLKNNVCLILFFLNTFVLFGQYPQAFVYDDESGLPSNEVYSILQDEKGFIWLGCDAGLYKFDGIRYKQYKSAQQKIKSITGLTQSLNGTLYCCNFQSQIFYLKNDSLCELPHSIAKILHITSDRNGNLLVNHHDGFSLYNERSKVWKHFSDFGQSNGNGLQTATRSVRVNDKGNICFLTATGVATYKNDGIEIVSKELQNSSFSSDYIVEWHDNEKWIFPISDRTQIFKTEGGQIVSESNPTLLKALEGRRTTSVRSLEDGNLWICTYTGIICYNPKKNTAEVYFPDKAFSDCIIDREGNYWFTTLQSGIIRVPDLEFVTWNGFKNNKLLRLAYDGNKVCFASVSGEIGLMDLKDESFLTFNSGSNALIQSLNYLPQDGAFFFYTNKNLYSLRNEKIDVFTDKVPSVKDVFRVGEDYILSSSNGVYVLSNVNIQPQKISNSWARDIAFDPETKSLWIASNEGLLKFVQHNRKWYLKRVYFEGTQVLSVEIDADNKVYFATYGGKIYALSKNGQLNTLVQLDSDVQVSKLAVYSQSLLIASNKGLWIKSLNTKNLIHLDNLSGLASNNIQDVLVAKGKIWLATGKGLQQIPFNFKKRVFRPLLYIRNRKLNMNAVQLDHEQSLTLYPEVSSYGSDGQFEYAYRINKQKWINLPGSVDEITFQSLPTGPLFIELKAINHDGLETENSLTFIGHVSPPYWRTWWFIVLVALVFILIVIFVFRAQLKKRHRQLEQQNEVNTSKLTAIQSQMNPHFIFNSLNSIQDLVLKGDVENSYTYLSSFSDLMRKTMNYSGKDFIDLDQEINVLEVYLSLEKLRFKRNFEYTITQRSTEGIQIPPLLVQPFIENSLIHGLLHKEGIKRLDVLFELLEDSLICTITDNGIGREAAKEIVMRRNKEHISFSGNAMQKRFEILSKVNKGDYGFSYVDLYDQNKGTGTQVILRMPIKRRF
jgi:ligand-binding sensor domain-containing protein